MAVRAELDEPAFMLATEVPTSGQRRLALAVVAVVFAAFGVAVAIRVRYDEAPKEWVWD